MSAAAAAAAVGEELISVKRGVKGFMRVYRSEWLWPHRAFHYLMEYSWQAVSHNPATLTLTSDTPLPPSVIWMSVSYKCSNFFFFKKEQKR